jgi:hypothetical protein
LAVIIPDPVNDSEMAEDGNEDQPKKRKGWVNYYKEAGHNEDEQTF